MYTVCVMLYHFDILRIGGDFAATGQSPSIYTSGIHVAGQKILRMHSMDDIKNVY